MTSLLLRLAAPLQSWGISSRFVRRTTATEPTKSGVLGLLAAALGRRRTDPIEDLLGLRFGVRLDQPGHLLRDFQTARSLDGRTSMPLSYRFYLADAAFMACIEGPDEVLEALDDAVRHPVFPLYLGRRSCPPVGPVTLGLRVGRSVEQALATEPWRAAPWWQRKSAASKVRLETLIDCDGDDATQTLPDVPVSFDPERREYALRSVRRDAVWVLNPLARHDVGPFEGHQPMAALGAP